MKFAHIRISEYFTFAKQIFHREAISLARRANFVEKKTGQDLSFFLVGDGGFGTPPEESVPLSSQERVGFESFFTHLSECAQVVYYPGKSRSWFDDLVIDLASKRKHRMDTVFLFGGGWWIRTTEVDRQQIYSLSPLATREIPLELMTGLEPVTC